MDHVLLFVWLPLEAIHGTLSYCSFKISRFVLLFLLKHYCIVINGKSRRGQLPLYNPKLRLVIINISLTLVWFCNKNDK